MPQAIMCYISGIFKQPVWIIIINDMTSEPVCGLNLQTTNYYASNQQKAAPSREDYVAFDWESNSIWLSH